MLVAHLKRYWPLYATGAGVAAVAMVLVGSSEYEVEETVSDYVGVIVEAAKKFIGNSSIEHNNPGNLRDEGNGFQGEAGTWTSLKSGTFLAFDSAYHGLRALADVAINYQMFHGIKTLYSFGLRWANPEDNGGDDSYGLNLGKIMGIDPYKEISVIDNLLPLVKAIIRNENTIQPYDDATLKEAVNAVYALKGLSNYA